MDVVIVCVLGLMTGALLTYPIHGGESAGGVMMLRLVMGVFVGGTVGVIAGVSIAAAVGRGGPGSWALLAALYWGLGAFGGSVGALLSGIVGDRRRARRFVGVAPNIEQGAIA